MSLVPQGWVPPKANPNYRVTYTLKEKVKNAKSLVEKTAQSFEDKFGTGSLTVAITESELSFTATSKKKLELQNLPETFGVGKFVRGQISNENDDYKSRFTGRHRL